MRIVEAVVGTLAAEGLRYVGTMYGQFMLTAEGPRIIEINARFGDPEAMNTLSVLDSPYTELCQAMAGGTLDKVEVRFRPKATVCKYVVPKGYGTKPASDVEISVDADAIEASGARLYYASCNAVPGGVTTTTSRTLAVVGVADTIQDANEQAEQALSSIESPDVYIRHDIGTEELIMKRVAHMRALGRGRE